VSAVNGAASGPPSALRVDPASIPSELKDLHQWVCWKWAARGGKWTKPPMQPDGRPASHSESSTWVGFPQAWGTYEQGGFAGIGFVVTAEDPFVGIDLDKCRDPETAAVKPWAQKIIAALNSYTEISPSGTGIRIWLIAKLPEGRRRKGAIEIYESLRYLTLTGHHLSDTPTTIENRQAEIGQLHGNFWRCRHTTAAAATIQRR